MKPSAHAHQETIPDDPVQDALEGGRGHTGQEPPQVRSAEKISLCRCQGGELLLKVCGRLHDQTLQKVSYFATFRRPTCLIARDMESTGKKSGLPLTFLLPDEQPNTTHSLIKESPAPNPLLLRSIPYGRPLP